MAAIKVREMRDSARESEVRMTMCFLGGMGAESLEEAFASGSASGVVFSAGATSCESSGAASEWAAVIWGDDGLGAAGEVARAGEVSTMVVMMISVLRDEKGSLGQFY